MASTSTTTAKIPAELKPLFEQSVKRMLSLQGYYWGPGIQYANPEEWQPPQYGGDQGGTGGNGGGGGTPQPNTPPVNIRKPRRVLKPARNNQGWWHVLSPAITTQQATKNQTVTTQQAPTDETGDDEYDPLRTRDEYKQIIDKLYGFDPSKLPLPLQWRPRDIADINQNTPYNEALNTVMGMGDMSGLELGALAPATEARFMSKQQITGESLQNNPVLQAEWNAFRNTTMPEIQNQMALAGLGRSSSAANAISKAWAGILPQLYESQLGREERALERGIEGNRYMADFLLNQMGGRQFQRQQAKADRAWDIGKWYQDYLQSKSDADYQEWARHAGMAENALFQPFGSFVPATIGSKTRSK